MDAVETNICCATCCGGDKKHLYNFTDGSNCLWCKACGHVYTGLCDQHQVVPYVGTEPGWAELVRDGHKHSKRSQV